MREDSKEKMNMNSNIKYQGSTPNGEVRRGLPRGIRNNNPLNIRCSSGQTWLGECPEQGDRLFVQFSSMKWGIRAALIIMRTYWKKGYRTSGQIIHRWAPPTENNTDAYVKNVCTMTGLQPCQPLEENDYSKLVSAMSLIETGRRIPAEEIENVKQLFNIKITAQ